MRAVVLLSALVGCAEPVIDMSLKMPEMPANFDLSCVTAIDVAAHELEDEAPMDVGFRLSLTGDRDPCVEIDPQTTFEGIRSQIAGKFTVDLPDGGLAGIQIRGRAGSCKDTPNYHEAIFYGGATFDGGSMTIPLTPNISCAAKETYKARPIEIAAMIADPTHACRAVTDAVSTFGGNIRPSRLDPELPPLMFEAGASVAFLAAGTAMIGSFSNTVFNDSCITVAHEGKGIAGVTCVNKGAPTLCGAPGEIEIPVYPFVFSNAAINGAAYEEAGTLVLGSVWETNPNKPVADAVVTTAPGVKVEYVELRNGQPEVVSGATKTGPSGLFILYSSKVTTVSIAAPGHQTRTLTVGGGYELDGTVLAVLPKML
ncbi:MAG: hypothetical protein M4D80_26105 [Myxococcota bacterium]|nr:hypothetical protein [Myxococcota bacterium]